MHALLLWVGDAGKPTTKFLLPDQKIIQEQQDIRWPGKTVF
jgi:hypothetical protein